jgi:hypothetical protein
MAEFFLAFIIMLAAVAAMAIGVINGRKPISGTCGGLNNEGTCSLCGGDTAKCETVPAETSGQRRFYDAS